MFRDTFEFKKEAESRVKSGPCSGQAAREPTSDERRSGKWGEGRSVATLQVNVALVLK